MGTILGGPSGEHENIEEDINDANIMRMMPINI